jgi:hypothetical protein
MKELSIEEKAQAYDNALQVLHKYDGANIMFSQDLKEEMFPELAESEDERIREDIIRCLKYSGIKPDRPINPHVRTTMKDALVWLEKQDEKKSRVQPKQEWSEEDDKMLKDTIRFCEICGNQVYANWLKSLKPQSQWKPSDGQMERLKGIINSLPHQEVLYSLYQDLKKLKG